MPRVLTVDDSRAVRMLVSKNAREMGLEAHPSLLTEFAISVGAGLTAQPGVRRKCRECVAEAVHHLIT